MWLKQSQADLEKEYIKADNNSKAIFKINLILYLKINTIVMSARKILTMTIIVLFPKKQKAVYTGIVGLLVLLTRSTIYCTVADKVAVLYCCSIGIKTRTRKIKI